MSRFLLVFVIVLICNGSLNAAPLLVVSNPAKAGNSTILTQSSTYKAQPPVNKFTWFKKVQGKLINHYLIKRSKAANEPISIIKKVLSVAALVFGATSLLLLLALRNAFVFALLGAVVTGVAALPGNTSKKHRRMAVYGIISALLAVCILLIAISSAFNYFS